MAESLACSKMGERSFLSGGRTPTQVERLAMSTRSCFSRMRLAGRLAARARLSRARKKCFR